MAFFYGIIPNYAFAIVMLTIVIMGVLTPFTVKSTKSMMAMQKIQPEMKKLQVKYKGPENRQALNEEMMKLYKEHGVNPIGGCLPMLLQAPFLFILYSVIKGLSNEVLVNGKLVAQPRYIPSHGKMHDAIVLAGGHIKSFGMDLSLKPFSAHGSTGAAIPFFVFVAIAVGLQYFQMAQMTNRNKKTGVSVPSQQQTLQKIMPILFAYFYMVIPAAVVLYMIISTVIRIITQDVLFRTGVSDPGKIQEKEIPGAVKKVAEETKPSTLKSQQQSRSKAKRKRKAR
ncbi:MAG: YidC/Oxa1 family membrane protein insertase [Acidimicrobiaceae bacterium]